MSEDTLFRSATKAMTFIDLCAGMVVRDRDGRVVMLMGCNACNLSIWWGHRLKPDGRPDKDTMPVLLAKDVVALALRKKGGAFQMILPGIFG